ncbi:MAG: AbrB/MazE/SpoVT family DNA-binding domain-containing protein [Acidobacteriota bacterium]
MRTRIVRIGNSQGIRIAKYLLDQTGLQEEVEVEAEGNRLVIRPVVAPRTGWKEAFQAMAEAGEDRMLDNEPVATRWDEEEWEW